jgi:hypothetical protein
MDQFADTLFVNTTTTFSWADRLRVLFGAPLHMRVVVDTEHVIGATRTTTHPSVGRAPWLVFRPVATARGEQEG